MRKAVSNIISVIILVVIAILAVNIYNTQPDVKRAVDDIGTNAKVIAGEIYTTANNAVNEALTGKINGKDYMSILNSDKPAIPMDIKITTSVDDNDSQNVVTPKIGEEDLKSVWGETGYKGLTVYEYGKSLLNDEEKKVYIQIANAVRGVSPSVKIKSSCSEKEIKKAYSYFVYDHAEVFYLSGVNITYTGSGNQFVYNITFNYGYSGSKGKIESMRNEMGSRALSIVNSTSSLPTDLKKERAIHDKLLKNCSYDTKAMNNPEKYPDSCSAYGAIVNGKAICQGYAQAMKIMLSSAGIKTLYVTGKSKGDSHAWNMVYVGDKWRYLDATFDDPVFVDKNGKYTSYNTISYTYFNYIYKSDHTLGRFISEDPFNSSSSNYASMPKVVK